MHAPVAQWIEHSFPKAGVGGSIPLGGACFPKVFEENLLCRFPVLHELRPFSVLPLTNSCHGESDLLDPC